MARVVIGLFLEWAGPLVGQVIDRKCRAANAAPLNRRRSLPPAARPWHDRLSNSTRPPNLTRPSTRLDSPTDSTRPREAADRSPIRAVAAE
jgi:hypothetical protein